MANSSNPPSLPGTLSRPDAQRIIDALNLRIWELEQSLAGTVKANGEREAGSGFTSEKTSTGNYKITLSPALATNGVMVVSLIAGGGEATQGFPSGPSKTSFTVGLVNNTPASKDGSFHFMIKAT